MLRIALIATGWALLVACGNSNGRVVRTVLKPPVIENPPEVVPCDFGARASAGLQFDYWEQWCVRSKQMEGPYERYTLDGQLIVSGRYEKSAAVGRWTFNYDDGMPKVVGVFENHLPVGRWEWQHPNGNNAQVGAFSGGVKVGKWVTWFANGTKASEGYFLGGRRDGEWTYWTPEGTVERTQRWDQGNLVQDGPPG